MMQARALSQVENGQLDIIWTMTSIEREATLSAVYVPLTKGLLSHRLLIIRREDLARFNKVDSLEKLQMFKAGQGHDWPDLKILRYNMLPTMSSSSYEGLFGMLFMRRFDYFPRGLQEAWPELTSLATSDLIIEPRLLLQYPAPVYFFVHPKNKKLNARISAGLKIAMADGSFNTLLYNYPAISQALRKANIAQRQIITLSNPLLSPRSLSLLKDKSLWYSHGEEHQYQSQ